MNDFNLDEAIGGLISKTSWYMKTYFNNKIKENGLDVTPEQWTLLIIIFKNPGVSQTDIAKNGLKDKTNVTRILDVLEKKKYIIRKNDENDRRIYKIYLTKNGENILKKLFPIVEAVNITTCKDLEDNELLQLKKSLLKIIDTLKNLI